MSKIILLCVMALIISGCGTDGDALLKGIDACENNGGVDFFDGSGFKADQRISCKNGAQFYIYKIKEKP